MTTEPLTSPSPSPTPGAVMEEISLGPVKESKLLLDAIAAASFMVELREAPVGSIPNETILTHYQAMVDDRVIDLMAATVTLCIEMIKNGYIKRPVTYPESKAGPAPTKSRLIVPPGVPNNKRK